jgi:hypothetical protein
VFTRLVAAAMLAISAGSSNATGEHWGGGEVPWIPWTKMPAKTIVVGAFDVFSASVVLYDPAKAYSVPHPLMKFMLRRAEWVALESPMGVRETPPGGKPTPKVDDVGRIGNRQMFFMILLKRQELKADCYAANRISRNERRAILDIVDSPQVGEILRDHNIEAMAITPVLSGKATCPPE